MDKNEIVEDYKGLVYDIANDIKIPNSACLDQEDLYQLGFIGLLEACDKYNPDSDNDFTLMNGTVEDNGLMWCPYCGKKIKVTKEKM